MPGLKQNDRERLSDHLERGLISADEANVEQVRMARVRLVTTRLPAQVRKALNAAVKAGYLGHMRKYGDLPEAYFHPTFDYLAREQRRAHADIVLRAIFKAMVPHANFAD